MKEKKNERQGEKLTRKIKGWTIEKLLDFERVDNISLCSEALVNGPKKGCGVGLH